MTTDRDDEYGAVPDVGVDERAARLAFTWPEAAVPPSEAAFEPTPPRRDADRRRRIPGDGA